MGAAAVEDQHSHLKLLEAVWGVQDQRVQQTCPHLQLEVAHETSEPPAEMAHEAVVKQIHPWSQYGSSALAAVEEGRGGFQSYFLWFGDL